MLSGRGQRRIVDASLLRVIVDQFVERATHPLSDIEQFETLALGLIDVLDAENVARLAPPLCRHPETPPSIFARLFEKGGDCMRLAFEFAPEVSALDLLATAEQGPAEHAAAIARRGDLDRDVVNALASRGESVVLRALAANRAAHFDPASRRALVLAGRDDLTLARMLLDRDDLDIDAEPLFLAATRLERVAIVLAACRSVVSSGVSEAIRRADATFLGRLEAAALRNGDEEMVVVLADALDCRKSRVRAVLADTSGEALALALVSLGVGRDAATRIFLCADPAISYDVNRVRALLALMRFTPQRAASHVIAAITGSARQDREATRRPGAREEAPTAAAPWRRIGQTRATVPAPGKTDRSA